MDRPPTSTTKTEKYSTKPKRFDSPMLDLTDGGPGPYPNSDGPAPFTAAEDADSVRLAALTDPAEPDYESGLRAPDAGSPDPDVHAWLDSPEPEYDWLIEGLLERGDRLILTGGEGDGKTTLLRQMAVTSSAGIHPFTFDDTDPIRVLYIDLENGDRFSRRQFRPLVVKAGKRLNPTNLTVLIKPSGLDLLEKDDQTWLTGKVEANKPDLLIVGPMYKLIGGNPNDEEPARAATKVIDGLRADYALAVIIEAHSPHGQQGTTRPGRPYGASLLKRWPEFGIELTKEGRLKNWRGARDERAWPTHLKRGGEWPLEIDWFTSKIGPTSGPKFKLVQGLVHIQPVSWTDWKTTAEKTLKMKKTSFNNHVKSLLDTALIDLTGEKPDRRYFLTEEGEKLVGG